MSAATRSGHADRVPAAAALGASIASCTHVVVGKPRHSGGRDNCCTSLSTLIPVIRDRHRIHQHHLRPSRRPLLGLAAGQRVAKQALPEGKEHRGRSAGWTCSAFPTLRSAPRRLATGLSDALGTRWWWVSLERPGLPSHCSHSRRVGRVPMQLWVLRETPITVRSCGSRLRRYAWPATLTRRGFRRGRRRQTAVIPTVTDLLARHARATPTRDPAAMCRRPGPHWQPYVKGWRGADAASPTPPS